jgi:hypothetical protein
VQKALGHSSEWFTKKQYVMEFAAQEAVRSDTY